MTKKAITAHHIQIKSKYFSYYNPHTINAIFGFASNDNDDDICSMFMYGVIAAANAQLTLFYVRLFLFHCHPFICLSVSFGFGRPLLHKHSCLYCAISSAFTNIKTRRQGKKIELEKKIGSLWKRKWRAKARKRERENDPIENLKLRNVLY